MAGDSGAGLLRKVLDWLALRDERLAARREAEGLRCELRLPAEPDVGFHGRPACYLAGEDIGEWCEPCRARRVPYATMLSARKAERLALQRVLRAGKGCGPVRVRSTGDVTTDVPY